VLGKCDVKTLSLKIIENIQIALLKNLPEKLFFQRSVDL